MSLEAMRDELKELRKHLKPHLKKKRAMARRCWTTFDIYELMKIQKNLDRIGVNPVIYEIPELTDNCLYCGGYWQCMECKALFLENKILKERVKGLKNK